MSDSLVDLDFREMPTATEGAPAKSGSSAGPRSQSPVSQPQVEGGRYEIQELLGVGGMGRVFKARDKLLSRHVALKFVREDDPSLLDRFLREAQAQAGLDHENICKVFEVGETGGKVYISMQYIQGQSLKALKKTLRIEQKVKMMLRVSEALHVAHRQGLVHRDIKPANIMVEPRENGDLHPYLMDFGLAREISAEGRTQTGVIEGTPAYMPPEQVRGEIHKLDRRSDVYALGATLFDILAGRPPFIGETSLEMMLSALQEEPPLLRSFDPTLPADLETIVAKCLEKDPSRRYDSARALADDLGRFLDGEPIAARRASFAYVALKKARKHRAVVSVAVVAFSFVLLLVVLFLRTRAAAASQAAYARVLGQDIKEIELFMQYALALPTHEIEREKKTIRARMAQIRERMSEGGQTTLGPSHYALGRGYLLLDDPEAATSELSMALDMSFSTPDVEFALGRAEIGLLRRAIEEARRVEDPKLRAKREKDVEARYLISALAHFQKSHGAADASSALIDANIAYLAKRYEDAAKLAETAATESPWRAEPHELLGRIFLATARRKYDAGEFENAVTDLSRALEAYDKAAEMLRSDPDIAIAIADAWMLRVDIERARQEPLSFALDKARAACDQTLRIDPNRAGAYHHLARIGYLRSMDFHSNDKELRPAFDSALASAEKALALDPKDAMTHDIVGNIHSSIALYDSRRGLDPQPRLELSKQSFARSIEADPGFAWPHNDLGGVYFLISLYEAARGIDPNRSCDMAIEHYRAARQIDPDYAFTYSNEADTEIVRAHYMLSHGMDPRPTLQRILDVCPLMPRNPLRELRCPESLIARSLMTFEYEFATQKATMASLDEAFGILDRAIHSTPSFSFLYTMTAKAYSAKMQLLRESNLDNADDLQKARAALTKASELGNKSAGQQIIFASVELLAAQYAPPKSKEFEFAWTRARSAVSKAIEQDSYDPESWTLLAELFYVRLLKRGPNEDDMKNGLDAAEHALSINPRFAGALLLHGALLLEKSKTIHKPEERSDTVKKARVALDAALRENPLLKKEAAPILQELEKIQ